MIHHMVFNTIVKLETHISGISIIFLKTVTKFKIVIIHSNLLKWLYNPTMQCVIWLIFHVVFVFSWNLLYVISMKHDWFFCVKKYSFSSRYLLLVYSIYKLRDWILLRLATIPFLSPPEKKFENRSIKFYNFFCQTFSDFWFQLDIYEKLNQHWQQKFKFYFLTYLSNKFILCYIRAIIVYNHYLTSQS